MNCKHQRTAGLAGVGLLGLLLSAAASAQTVPMGSGPGMQPPVQRGQAEPVPYAMTPELQNATVPMGSGPGTQPRVQRGQAEPVPFTPTQEHRNATLPMGSGPGVQPRIQSAQANTSPALASEPTERTTMSHAKRTRHARKH